MFGKKDFSYWRKAHHIGFLFAVLFAICFAWYFIRPVEQVLHMQLLKMSYFGFDGMNTKSFVLGLAQSYAWGYVLVIILKAGHILHPGKKCCKK